jgi:hypothetical protein
MLVTGWIDPYFQPADASLLTKDDLSGGRTTPGNTATRGGHKDRPSDSPQTAWDKRRRFRPHGRGCDPFNGTQHALRVTRDAATPAQITGTDGMAVWLSADAAHLKDD